MLILVASFAIASPAGAAPPKLTPLSAAQKQAVKKFHAAMKRGRVATDKKDYAVAVKAFSDALAVEPNEPEALAERGYAHLLAKEYDAASADLDAAAKRAAAASQQGMIWFNVGLLAEARGDAAAAKHAYAESNRIRPSKAAAKKLGGAAVCDAAIDKTRTAGTVYASWVAAAKGLRAAALAGGPIDGSTDDDAPKAPTTEAAARAWLCGDDGCDGSGPWIVAIPDSVGDLTYDLVIGQKGGHLLTFAGLGGKMLGRCESEDQIEVLGGAPLQVHVTIEPNDMVDVDTSSGELKSCGDNLDGCHEACFYSDKSDQDLFIDATSGAQILSVVRPFATRDDSEFKLDEDFTQKVTLTRTITGVTLAGGACDQSIPFAAK